MKTKHQSMNHNLLLISLLCICMISMMIQQIHTQENKCDRISLQEAKKGILNIEYSTDNPMTCTQFSTKSPVLFYIRPINLYKEDNITLMQMLGFFTQGSTISPEDITLVAKDEGDWNLEVRFGPSLRRRSLEIVYNIDLHVKLVTPVLETIVIEGYIDFKHELTIGVDIEQSSPLHNTMLMMESDRFYSIDVEYPGIILEKSGFIYSEAIDLKLKIKPDFFSGRISIFNVLKRCSSYKIDPVDYKFSIHGQQDNDFLPDQLMYRCIQILVTSDPNGYIRTDFSSFEAANLPDSSHLIMSDGISSHALSKEMTSLLHKKFIDTRRNELVILYVTEWDRKYKENTLLSTGLLYSGYHGNGQLKAPKNKSSKYLTYMHKGMPYPTIVLMYAVPHSMIMKIYDTIVTDDALVTFNAGEAVPPILSLGYNSTLIVEFSATDGNHFTSIPPYEFTTSETFCHKLSTGLYDYWSLDKIKEEQCTWTISTSPSFHEGSSLVLSLDKLDFINERDCVFVLKLNSHARGQEIVYLCGRRQSKQKIKLSLDKTFKYAVSVMKDVRTHHLSFEASYSFVKDSTNQ